MDKLKQYVIFTVLGCLVVLAAGWFVLVSPKRSDAADLRNTAAQVASQNSQLQTQLTILKAQAKALPKQQANLAAVAAKIPDNPALPALVRSLTAAATSAGIELVSVTPGVPTLPAAAAPAAAPLPASAAAAASAASAGQLSQIPLSLSVVGGYFEVEQFISNLEGLQRSMRVTGLSLSPGTNPMKPAAAGSTQSDDGKSLTTTITAQVFMAANRPPTTAVTVPGQAVAGTAVGPAAPVIPAKK